MDPSTPELILIVSSGRGMHILKGSDLSPIHVVRDMWKVRGVVMIMIMMMCTRQAACDGGWEI